MNFLEKLNFLRIVLLGATLSTKIFHEYGPWTLNTVTTKLTEMLESAVSRMFNFKRR